MPRLRPAVLLLLVAICLPRGVQAAPDPLPERLSDTEFWQMVEGFSEPGGFFRSDNLVSNESSFQLVIPELKRRQTGGVYLGVGPDQNFTYITALKPQLAFIIDIRRQNMLLHLMYKALMEMSNERADFLALLFSKPRPAGLGQESSPEELFQAFAQQSGSNALYEKNMTAILDHLTKRHGFTLADEDDHAIEYVYRSFRFAGQDIRYSFPQQSGAGAFPTFADLQMEADARGYNHSYLSTEADFQSLKALHERNLIVPLVGDFGGPKAIRQVGTYLRQHDSTVRVFYTSNVEQYLFQSDAWLHFYESVAALPTDASSTFVRAYFNIRFRVPRTGSLMRSETLLDPVREMVEAYRKGEIRTYMDVIARSN